MAVTVRESHERIDDQKNRITTLTMQDGSTQVITVYNPYPPGKNYVDISTQVAHYDSHNEQISLTQTYRRNELGVDKTVVNWANGTQFIITQTPDGKRTASFTLFDGRHGVLPPNNPIFTGPVHDTIGGGITALDAHVERSGKIPMLTPESVHDVGKVARFAGPALGIAATVYEMDQAGTGREACVAGISGTFGTLGDYVGGAGGAVLGTLGGEFAAPVAVPVSAATVAWAGGKSFGWIGQKVGEAFCPH
jgi:hypothetical protein